jgi:hypothetical protein
VKIVFEKGVDRVCVSDASNSILTQIESISGNVFRRCEVEEVVADASFVCVRRSDVNSFLTRFFLRKGVRPKQFYAFVANCEKILTGFSHPFVLVQSMYPACFLPMLLVSSESDFVLCRYYFRFLLTTDFGRAQNEEEYFIQMERENPGSEVVFNFGVELIQSQLPALAGVPEKKTPECLSVDDNLYVRALVTQTRLKLNLPGNTEGVLVEEPHLAGDGSLASTQHGSAECNPPAPFVDDGR